MAVREKRMTVEEFWEQYAGQPYELVHGEVKEVAPTGLSHGAVASRIIAHLRLFIDQNAGLGEIYSSETGFYLSSDVMRAPDAAFIRQKRLEDVEEPAKFAPFAPDLAVEVISPSETAADIQEKVDLYLKAGTATVWLAYTDTRKVVIYRADQTFETLAEGDTLRGEDVLPGFEVQVSAFFPPKKDQA